ncbi:MAG: helix-turn-helix domain-containing protein [Phycisphaerae bacterium]
MKPDARVKPSPPVLALRPKEAAQALGISDRLLWTKTNCGEIPHIKIGRATLYPVDALRHWLDKQIPGASSPA